MTYQMRNKQLKGCSGPKSPWLRRYGLGLTQLAGAEIQSLAGRQSCILWATPRLPTHNCDNSHSLSQFSLTMKWAEGSMCRVGDGGRSHYGSVYHAAISSHSGFRGLQAEQPPHHPTQNTSVLWRGSVAAGSRRTPGKTGNPRRH